MALFIIVLVLTFGPALAVALVPDPFWRPLAGWVVVPAGLLWLEERNIPFQDLGIFGGMGTSWALVVGLTVVIAAVIRWFRSLAREQRRGLPALADWHLPAAVVAAVFFFHWLANRLAGESPALTVHIIVIATALAASGLLAGALWFARDSLRARPVLRSVTTGMLLFACAFLVIVAKGTASVASTLRLASDEAAGRPYCMLTFAGRDQFRPARGALELSPLVSRSGGRNFIEDAYWLVVQSADGPQRLRLRQRKDRDYFSARAAPASDSMADSAPCNPQPGGGIRAA
jgi:hypothetical protein